MKGGRVGFPRIVGGRFGLSSTVGETEQKAINSILKEACSRISS